MPRPDPFEILPGSDIGRSKVVKSFKAYEFSDLTLESKNTESPTLKQQVMPNRLKIAGYLFIFFVGVLLFRSVWLQLVNGNKNRESAENNRLRIVTTVPPRGIIFDKNGEPLVSNIAEFSLGLIPADLPKDNSEKQSELQELANLASIPMETLNLTLKEVKSTDTNFLAIKEHLDYHQAMKLKILFKDDPAVKVEVVPKRQYLNSLVFSQILGYTGKISQEEWQKLKYETTNDYHLNDITGKTGVEFVYEKELRGISGKSSVEVNAQRREQKVIAAEAPVAGQNLVLTIDAALQKILYDAADATVKSLNTTGAAVVAINPKTGGVLSAVNAPGYDNNAFVSGIKALDYEKLVNDKHKLLFFRAIAGEYPSGSTIKPIIAVAALDQNVITPQTAVLSSGGIRIDKWFFPDWKAGGHGVTNIYKAIADSVNTFFYTIGGGTETFQGLGIDRMTQYARTFGLGAETGIDLPGESPGFLPSKAWKEQTKGEAWYIGDTYHFAIGQGDLLVTPLQMALATATIANGGTLYRPHLLQAFKDSDGNITREYEPEVIRDNIAKPEAFTVVKDAMREAVVSGSAIRLNSLPVPTCGKTGTAQYSNNNKTHAWFIGFAPCDNPTIAIAVLVEGGGEGHASALPIAEKGFKYWFSQQNPAK